MVLDLYQENAGREAMGLLPTGHAWTRAPESVLSKLLSALGFGSARAECRAADLVEEADPRTTSEMLSDWERNLGLPDECLPLPGGSRDRRALVAARAVGTASASASYFLELAQSLGYSARIEEGTASPFRVGANRCGDSLGTEYGVFDWTLVVEASRRTLFRLGASRVGDPLITYADKLLECVIERATPAHTKVRFRYEPEGSGPGDPVDECWWLVGNPSGPDLRMVTKDGEMVVYGEDGAAIDLGLRDGAVPVLDENGVEIEVPVQCEIPPEGDCVLQVGIGAGAQLGHAIIDDALVVQDQTGGEISLAIIDQALPVLDADGGAIRLPLSCGDVEELWWHVLEPNTGEQLNIRTAGGSVLVTLEDGSRLPISSPDQPFTVLDEAGNTLTIPLSVEQA